MMFNPETNTYHIEHYTDLEVAEYLHLHGINKLTSKNEKLAFAKNHLTPLLPTLWEKAKSAEYRQRREALAAERLARRIEYLDGLMSIIKLAGVARG